MSTEYIILIILYVSIMGVILKVLKQRDQKIKLEKYKIDIKYGPVLNAESQLDKLIDSIFDEYRFYNLEYKDNEYINSLDEQNMIKEVCDIITERISPVLMTQLSTYFNSDNIGEIIAVKVSTKVAEYKILVNTNG